MYKISVIVPIFNVEKFLNKCVESIVNQTYKNLEIILVDDESSDNCPKICDNWAEKDTRIKVIHKKNGGVSSARNIGIENATGDYIAFVDGDDFIELSMYEELLNNIIKNKSDIVFCNFIEYYNQNNKKEIKENFEILDKNIILSKFFIREDKKSCYASNIMASIWRSLYKTSIVKTIRFNEKISYCEDMLFNIDYLTRIENISYCNKYLYNYIQHEKSYLHKKTKKLIDNMIKFEKILIFKINNIFNESELNYIKFYHYKRVFNNISQLKDSVERKNSLKELNDLNFNTKNTYKAYINKIKGIKLKIIAFLVHHNMLSIMSFALKLRKNI